MKKSRIYKRIYGAVTAVLVMLLLSFGNGADTAFAQGSVNVTVTGIPSVINTPFVDVFEENFRNGRYQVIFTYNSSNPQPVDFRFDFRVTRDGKEVLAVTSNPKSFRPGAYVFTSIFDELTFPQTLEDLLDDLGQDIRNQIIQAGSAPEGNYVLYVEAIPVNGSGMINSPPSVNPFSVIYPEAPRLINPSDNSNVALETPVFNWMNVAISGFSIEYDFLLVEVLQNQTALQAISSNRAIAERTLLGQNTLVYTPEFLPLEAGQEYAWRVTAKSDDGLLPLKNDGESTVHTFVYKQGGLATGLDDLEAIDLIPGFARLTNLQSLEIDEQSTSYVLDGQATMELDYGETYELPVQVRGLTIQKGSPQNPNVLAGMVEVEGRADELPALDEASRIVDFNTLRWAYNKGVQAAGELKLPDGSLAQADGWIQLTPSGLSGSLIAENPTGVLAAGEDPVELYLDRFKADFPAMQLFAEGRVELFDGTSVCDLTQLNVLEDEAQAVFSCPDDAAVSLAANSAQLELILDNLTGIIDYDFENNQFGYDLNADGSIAFGLDQAGQCSVRMQVNLKDVSGFQISEIIPVCSVYAPPLNLGFVKLKLDDIRLSSLTYEKGNNWDFDLSLEGAMSFPAMDGWTLPISTVDVTKGGLRFPDLKWNAQQLGITQPFSVNGFEIEPTHFTMPKFTFPWFEWTQDDIDEDRTGDWNFMVDFDFNFPNFSGESEGGNDNILPVCLATRKLRGITGSFEKGDFSARIPATVLRDCRVDLGGDYTFIINELRGQLSASASSSDMNLNSRLDLDAGFEAGYPFSCTQKGGQLSQDFAQKKGFIEKNQRGGEKINLTQYNVEKQIAKTNLSMKSNGLLEGQIEDIVNECAVNLGPFTAGVTQSDLVFEIEGGRQQLAIEAGGELALNQSQKVEGSLKYNVLKGTFDELDFNYDDSYLMSLPSEDNSALSFLVNGLSLTEDGILINGRQEFIFADPDRINTLLEQQKGIEFDLPKDITTIGVTFDSTLIALDEFGIRSGRIIFDKSFVLKAGLDEESTAISFQVADTSSMKDELEPNSMYTGVGQQVIIDKNGLHTRGRAEAGLRVGDLAFDDVSVEFSKRFTMGLNPFGVQQGQADVHHKSRRIAYINSSGFHLDPSYLTRAIPDTLPLPNKETAYIVLRDQDDNLKVSAQNKSDGTFTMSTDEPVQLVIPALAGNGQAPEVAVSFSNITYDSNTGDVTEGAIEGVFNPAIDLNTIGIPLKLKKIRYDDGIAINDQSFAGERGLFLEGDLLLYEHQVGDAGSVALFLENGNRLRGDVKLGNLDAEIPLVSQSDFATLNVDSLKGSVNVPLTDDGAVTQVSFDMGGQLRFQNDSEPLAALNYRARYNNKVFTVNAISQPSGSQGENTAFIGPLGFRINEIETFSLNYRSATKDFDFLSKLDFSLLMDISDGDTLEVPLQSVEITENGFLIPEQDINSSSRPALNAPPAKLGPTELTVLEFRVLHDISFNWFTGEEITPSFAMDLEMKLDALSENSPEASNASVTIDNVGYNQGVITGYLQDYEFQGDGAQVLLGGSAYFNLTNISGGLTNDGTEENPVQGFDIHLLGNLETPDLFSGTGSDCSNPVLDLNLSAQGGLVGSATNIAPCGTLVYGPATLDFDNTSSLNFSFSDDEQSVVLDGGVSAEIVQPESPNITASGNIEMDIIQGDLIDGSILINQLFTYQYPQTNPMFTFRVQQAKLDQSGLIFTGDAGLAFPNSEDTARVEFTNFTINPKSDNIAGGSLTVEDSVAFEVGVSPIDWEVVDPASAFTRDNAGRLVTTAGITINNEGLSLNGNSTASIRAGGQNFPDVGVAYNGFKIGFAPTKVTEGRAEFTLDGESSTFGYLDKEKFHLNIPGLITSVIPDTLGLPNMETAYLVLGDESGNRYELDESQSRRMLRTRSGKSVELVIPKVENNSNEPLKVQVAFDIAVDDYMNVTDGSVALVNPVDLSEYVDIPLSLDSLNYDGGTQELLASATVILPSSLEDVELKASTVVGRNGFEQASISAGTYTQNYYPDQENVTPIAADTLGGGSFMFFVRGLELEFGQTNSLAFSGQLKSDLLKNNEDEKTPVHYAASYGAGEWNVSIDNGNLTGGIDLGFAQIEPIPDGGEMFSVTMNQDEFAVAFAGIISMEEFLGDGFSLELQQLKLSTLPDANGNYVTATAEQSLPPQEFALVNNILKFSSTNTAITLDDGVLGISTGGTFSFYEQTELDFQDLEFKSDGTISVGDISGNLLPEPIEVISDSMLVLKNVSLGVQDEKVQMTAKGSAKLPAPLESSAEFDVSFDTDGDFDISGPDFIFDDDFEIGNNPSTEFPIKNFATLELTGIGVGLNFDAPSESSLYASAVVFIENDVDKRIMFGKAGNLEDDPGIKYTPGGGIEWNVSSNFDFDNSPLSFDYDFFSISVEAISIDTDGEDVPFRAEIGGEAGLSIAGVTGKAGFEGFTFSTEGISDVGRFTKGGTFSLMDVVSLELGTFEHEAIEDGETPLTLTFNTGSGSADSAQVSTEEVTGITKYLKFGSNSKGKAINLSLSEAISGGVEEVIYYETEDGDQYFKIKNASLELNEQASITAGMEFLTKGDDFSLSVAGAGTFGSTGIAAAGSISTINKKLRFGIFVAAAAPVNLLGIVEVSSFGGGFYYRPTQSNLNEVTDVIATLSNGGFRLNGDPPDVQNLKFAALVYGELTLGGTSGASAITANALIQVTDQFTKIDANGYVLGQKNSFMAGMYLTILYTPDITGMEGGITMNIDYDPVLQGDSRVDFFAKKDRNSPESVLWGIDGHFSIAVINQLDVSGTILVSSDGLLLELGMGSGFDIAVISADASFELTVWYLPEHSDPFGVFGAFSVGFDVLKGLAEFQATVEGGYFDRGSYVMLYFAGEAYVKVLWVFDGNMKGWVKFQTKGDKFDYGRGSNAEMEDMIADAKDKANDAKEKAEETKNELDDAKEDLENGLTDPTQIKANAADLRLAGFNMITYEYMAKGMYGTFSRIEGIIDGNLPPRIDWISNNIMTPGGYEGSLPGAFNGYDLRNSMLFTDFLSKPEAELRRVENNLPDIQQYLDEATVELAGVAERMQSDLDNGQILNIQNPVRNVQQGISGAQGELLSAPSFQVDSNTVQSNQSDLNQFENKIQEDNQRYREAIKAASANISLVDLVLEGKASINWDIDTGIELENTSNVSVNGLSNLFMDARRVIGKYNALNTAIYWDVENWADKRINYLNNNKSAIENFWKNYNWNDDKRDQIRYAVRDMKNTISFQIDDTHADNQTIETINRIFDSENNANAKELYKQTSKEFWYDMPRLGLMEVRERSRETADSLSQAADSEMKTMNNSHAAFTKMVDNLYTIKSDMLVTLYGMIREYDTWRKESFGINSASIQKIRNSETVSVRNEQKTSRRASGNSSSLSSLPESTPDPLLVNKLEEIQTALAPPTIDLISGTVNNASVLGGDYDERYNVDSFIGSALLSFSASHATDIPEISTIVKKGTTGSVYYISDYYTIGSKGSNRSRQVNQTRSATGSNALQYYYPKMSLSQKSQKLVGAVRARGIGGTTVSRLVNFTIPVAPDGISASASVELGDDTTPPTKPIIRHDYKSYNNKYWSPDSSQLSFTFKSADHESDIRLFKYKIGTTKGGNEVRDWTDAQGTRGTGTISFLLASKLETTIRGLKLSPDTDYYLTVKSVNGDNMESDSNKVSQPFRYEPTSPSKPEVLVTYAANAERQKAEKTPIIRQAVTEAPRWDDQGGSDIGNWVLGDVPAQDIVVDGTAGSGTNYVVATADNDDNAAIIVANLGSNECVDRFEPSEAEQGEGVTLSWSSEDDETDIEGFYWSKKSEGNLFSQDAFGDNDCAFYEASEITEWSTTPSYEGSEYWYFQARNNAGMKSGMTVVGPIEKIDATVPETPNVKVRAGMDGFYIYVTKLASDKQTGIKGYQYALLDSAGTDTLRAWPDPGTVDFELEDNAKSRSNPPSEFIPWGTFMESGFYQVSVRAVNGQNMPSRAVTNTGVLHDKTPPEPTLFTVNYRVNTGELTLEITDYGDSESGVSAASYEIVSKMDPVLLKDFIANPNNKMQHYSYESDDQQVTRLKAASFKEEEPDEETVLESGTIRSYSRRRSQGIILKRLEYLSPVVVRIKVRNGVGLERVDEKPVQIPRRLLMEILENRKEKKKELRSKEEKDDIFRKTKTRGRRN